jgi:hypothetical protein
MAALKEAYRKVMNGVDKEIQGFIESLEGFSDSSMHQIYCIIGNYEKAEAKRQKVLEALELDKSRADGENLQTDNYESGMLTSIPILLALSPIAYCTKTYREFKRFRCLSKEEPEITVYRLDEEPEVK